MPGQVGRGCVKAKCNASIAALLLSGAAHAQNSVTLYGVIDEGLNYTNNAGSGPATQMAGNQWVGSRFGIKGSEDLGGGYKAIFQLENGFNPSGGTFSQGGRLFGRQAYVGFSSDRYGTLTFGRQYEPTADMFSDLTPAGNWAGNLGSVPYDSDNTGWDFRVNNAVKYVSPTLYGFSVEAMYAFSNTTGGDGSHLAGLAGQYQQGGLTAAIAYIDITNPGLTTNGAVANDSVFTASSQKNIDAGANYTFDKVRIGAMYSHASIGAPTGIPNYLSSIAEPANGGTWTAWKFDNFDVTGQYFFRPSFWAAAAYIYTIGKLETTAGNYSPKWHQLTLMLDYDLSKSTSLYIQGAYQHVVSAHTGTVFDDAFIFSGAAPSPSSTDNQIVCRLGMRYRF
jgi:predicted porin